MNVLKYIFCWVYERKSSKFDALASIAIGSMAITFLLMFNIGIIEGLFFKIFGKQIDIFFSDKMSFLFFLALYLLIIVYFRMNNKYRIECNKFKNYSPSNKRRIKTFPRSR